MRTPKFVVSQAEGWVVWAPHVELMSEVGQPCGAVPLTCEVCANSGECRNWIELLNTQLVSENWRTVMGKPHTFGIRSDVSKPTMHTHLCDRRKATKSLLSSTNTSP